jgi:hypothetical protein
MNGTTGRPASRMSRLATSLSIAKAEPVTAEPTNGHVRRFEGSLHCPILSIRPVQDREHNVEAHCCAASWCAGIAQHEIASTAWDQSDLQCRVGDCKRSSTRSRAVAGIADKPATIFGYADQRNFIPVEGRESLFGCAD